ncbi:metalloregulator ArsR/SmtB family transcription factor [Rhizobium sp. XQZ8]|uniref:ArsR/SmtB family transcription factor n=1 Tax=Rhizobium populisoli TaxID=2859785 RepID=UPI001CA545AD|nr:metalloregulator ArsR/SmtB family transcription factor [Rhizobium populisoli]MBW6424802.1 metalloregulator ArsR/SmtB family transcription factor [Rhizobium populisoli]
MKDISKVRGSADEIGSARTEPGFDITRAARLLQALSNPARFRIVTLLMQQGHDVGTIAATVGLGQATTSQHLKILRNCGVVRTKRDAQRALYDLLDPGAARIVETVATVLGAMSQTPAILGTQPE